MTEAEKQKIIMSAFYDELEKNAQVQILPSIFKALKAVGKFFKTKIGTSGKLFNFSEKGLEEFGTKGIEGLRDYLAAFRHPKFQKGGKGLLENGSQFLKNNKEFVDKNKGWLSSQLSEKAEMFQNIKHGPGAVVKGYGQELRDSAYKQVNLKGKTFLGLGKEPIAKWEKGKGAVIKGKGIMPSRKILNAPSHIKDDVALQKWIADNPEISPIVKKRILMRGLSGAVTTPAMTATPFVFGGLNGTSAKESIRDGATMYVPGGWEARLAYDFLGPK